MVRGRGPLVMCGIETRYFKCATSLVERIEMWTYTVCRFTARPTIHRKIISGKNDAREEAKIGGVFQSKPDLEDQINRLGSNFERVVVL